MLLKMTYYALDLPARSYCQPNAGLFFVATITAVQFYIKAIDQNVFRLSIKILSICQRKHFDQSLSVVM